MNGLCECGCGHVTAVATKTDRGRGHVRGEHIRFIQGHNNHLRRAGHIERDCDHGTPCWIWQGALNDRGYGTCFGGLAHRDYYERYVGPVPAGLTLDHLCRNRACVNPAHLEPVTHAENTRRGAAARVPRHRSPVADEIRSLRRRARLSQRALGERLGVTQALIGHWERGYCEPPTFRLEQVRRELAEGYRPPDEPAVKTFGSRAA